MCEERRGTAVQRLCPVVILAPAPSDVHRPPPPPSQTSTSGLVLGDRRPVVVAQAHFTPLPFSPHQRLGHVVTSTIHSLATFLMKRTTTRGEVVVVVGRGSIGFSSDSSAFESGEFGRSSSIVDSWPRRGFELELSPARSF